MKKPELHHEAFDHELALLKADERIAIDVGFIRRKPRKIEPLQLLKAFCMIMPGSCPSLRSLAAVLSVLRSESISKQAVARRLGRAWIDFLKQMLALLLCRHIEPGPMEELFSGFGRVLLHDSSVLPLPASMARYYKGSRNQSGNTFSQAKVQAILDIKNRSYIKFDVTSFTRNDQSAAADILEILSPGDVIIRDLGYFVTGILSRIEKAGAFFLSRYHHRCSVFDVRRVPLDILKVLERDGEMDARVRIGSSEKFAVRMIALPVPACVANERRRLMRQNRDTRCHPGKRQLKLLGWMIFITNITDEIWDRQKIRQIYRLRWRIEVVFKAFKGHFGIRSYSYTASRYQIESIIYTRLIYILLFQIVVYNPLLYHIDSRYKRKVSLLKLASFFTRYYWLVLPVPQCTDKDFLVNIFGYFCTYDKRKRANYEDLLEKLGKTNKEN